MASSLVWLRRKVCRWYYPLNGRVLRLFRWFKLYKHLKINHFIAVANDPAPTGEQAPGLQLPIEARSAGWKRRQLAVGSAKAWS
jgi:hypothetical protein